MSNLTSKIPLNEIATGIQKRLNSNYVALYSSNSKIEIVRVWPKSTGYLGRLFGTPIVEVSRQTTGLMKDLPDYSTRDESVISTSRLKEIVYGNNTSS